MMDRATFMNQLEAFHKENGVPLRPGKLLGRNVDLYDLFVVSMKQGGFPRVNKNNKWSYLLKSLKLVDESERTVPGEYQAQIKSFYVKWIRAFEGERVPMEVKRHMIPPGMELPPRKRRPDSMSIMGDMECEGGEGRSADYKGEIGEGRVLRSAPFGDRRGVRPDDPISNAGGPIFNENLPPEMTDVKTVFAPQHLKSRKSSPCTDVWRLCLGIENRAVNGLEFCYCLNNLYLISLPYNRFLEGGLSLPQFPKLLDVLLALLEETQEIVGSLMDAECGIAVGLKCIEDMSSEEVYELMRRIIPEEGKNDDKNNKTSGNNKNNNEDNGRVNNIVSNNAGSSIIRSQVLYKFHGEVLSTTAAILCNIMSNPNNRYQLLLTAPLESSSITAETENNNSNSNSINGNDDYYYGNENNNNNDVTVTYDGPVDNMNNDDNTNKHGVSKLLSSNNGYSNSGAVRLLKALIPTINVYFKKAVKAEIQLSDLCSKQTRQFVVSDNSNFSITTPSANPDLKKSPIISSDNNHNNSNSDKKHRCVGFLGLFDSEFTPRRLSKNGWEMRWMGSSDAILEALRGITRTASEIDDLKDEKKFYEFIHKNILQKSNDTLNSISDRGYYSCTDNDNNLNQIKESSSLLKEEEENSSMLMHNMENQIQTQRIAINESLRGITHTLCTILRITTATVSLVGRDEPHVEAVFGTFCEGLVAVQSISHGIVPRVFHSTLGLSVLHSAMELGCQLLLYRHACAIQNMELGFQICGALLRMELEHIKLPRAVLKTSLAFVHLCSEHFSSELGDMLTKGAAREIKKTDQMFQHTPNNNHIDNTNNNSDDFNVINSLANDLFIDPLIRFLHSCLTKPPTARGISLLGRIAMGCILQLSAYPQTLQLLRNHVTTFTELAWMETELSGLLWAIVHELLFLGERNRKNINIPSSSSSIIMKDSEKNNDTNNNDSNNDLNVKKELDTADIIMNENIKSLESTVVLSNEETVSDDKLVGQVPL